MTQIIHSYNNGEIKNLIFLEPERSISIMAAANRKHITYQHFRQEFVHGNRPQLFECAN